MANKSAPRSWSDVQFVIATGSMALTLAFWNMFAGPDREAAMKQAQERAAVPPPPMEVAPQPQAIPTGPILLGGSAPQTTIVVQKGGGGGGDNGAVDAGGGGGGATTSTGSS